MSLSFGKFCGMAVRDFKTSIGWGSQTSQLSVTCVPDPLTGDSPQPPPYGQPIYFQAGGFSFGGYLQRWQEIKDLNGNPAFEAICCDPRSILEGATVIVGAYQGPVNVRNLVNAYGYWEAQGFGASQENEAGMPCSLVLQAVNDICNTPGVTAAGGPLSFRGIDYSLDLSQVPVPPPFYRISGPGIGLMDLIAQLCEDSGCDYFVELVGFTIRIRTVSRFFQPPLGTIASLALSAAYSGQCPQVRAGVEVRNELTSAFLVGGAVTGLHLTSAIASFWGYDLGGSPILGQAGTHPDAGPAEFMSLNATGVADIIGSTSYPTNTVEMRCALVSYEAWSSYIKKYRPALSNVVHCMFGKGIINPKAKVDLVDDRTQAVLQAADSENYTRAQRLHEFVKGYGEDFMGKQFLVQLPYVLARVDSETLQVTYSAEPTDAGYLDGGIGQLGISGQNQEVFLAPDERVLPFAYYGSITGQDTSRISWGDSAVEGDSLYVKADVNPKMLFLDLGTGLPTPCVLLKLPSVLHEEALDPYGDSPIINAAVADGGEATKAVDKNGPGGTIGSLRVFPNPTYPTLVAVPLKSNVATYGPWFVAGPPGKVRFDHDPGLTPWEYGGADVMNAAGEARVTNAVAFQQLSESGTVEVVGLPSCSLGDVLQSGGPNVTHIEVSVGDRGYTTSYAMETFTQQFGLFAKANVERLKRSALAAVGIRRDLRKALAKQIAALQTTETAFRGFLRNAPKYVKRESPHDVLMAKAIEDDSDVRVFASADTYEEALVIAGPDQDDFDNTVIMSTSGLVRPFTTDTDGGTLLPSYVEPADVFDDKNNGAVRQDSLNPFADNHDIEVVTSGNGGYSPPHAYDHGSDPASTRALALRGPAVMAGWGYDTNGKPVPADDSGDDFAENHMRRSDLWKAGPVDLLWDETRGVWTSHDVVTAKVATGVSIEVDKEGECWVGGEENWKIKVNNKGSVTLASETWLMVAYCLNENKWYALASAGADWKSVKVNSTAPDDQGYYDGLLLSFDVPTAVMSQLSPTVEVKIRGVNGHDLLLQSYLGLMTGVLDPNGGGSDTVDPTNKKPVFLVNDEAVAIAVTSTPPAAGNPAAPPINLTFKWYRNAHINQPFPPANPQQLVGSGQGVMYPDLTGQQRFNFIAWTHYLDTEASYDIRDSWSKFAFASNYLTTAANDYITVESESETFEGWLVVYCERISDSKQRVYLTRDYVNWGVNLDGTPSSALPITPIA